MKTYNSQFEADVQGVWSSQSRGCEERCGVKVDGLPLPDGVSISGDVYLELAEAIETGKKVTATIQFKVED